MGAYQMQIIDMKILKNLIRDFCGQKPITEEVKQMELEIWNRNRHFIWIFAVVSAVLAFMCCKSYYAISINELKEKLQHQSQITQCMFDSQCRLAIENLDFKTQQKQIGSIANDYYLQSKKVAS